MSDPITERAIYLAVGGEGKGDLFLVQQGRVEHLGIVRQTRRLLGTEAPADTGPPPDVRPAGGLRRLLSIVLAFVVSLTL